MPAKALPYDTAQEPLTCPDCGKVAANRSGLANHRRSHQRPTAPLAIRPLGRASTITVTRLSANDPAIEERIAEIAARSAATPPTPPSAHTILAADLTPRERALRQHGGAPKVGN